MKYVSSISSRFATLQQKRLRHANFNQEIRETEKVRGGGGEGINKRREVRVEFDSREAYFVFSWSFSLGSIYYF